MIDIKDVKNLDDIKLLISPQWLAGFFDGEGCVCLYRGMLNGYYNHMLSVYLTQKDATILAFVLLLFPEGKIEPATKNNTRLVLNGRNAKDFLLYIKDYSIVKKSQIIAGLEFIDTIKNGNSHGLDNEDREKRNKLYNILQFEKGKKVI